MKLIITLLAALLLASLAALHSAESFPPDLALQPAHIVVAPWPQHIPATKRQGVAGIERTAKGGCGRSMAAMWRARAISRCSSAAMTTARLGRK